MGTADQGTPTGGVPAAAPIQTPATTPAPAGTPTTPPQGTPQAGGTLLGTGGQSTTPPAGGTADKPGEGEGKTTETPPAQPVEIKLPEGVEVDQELFEVVKASVKDSASGQKLVEAYVKAMTAQEQKIRANYEQTQKMWVESIKNDADLGGAKFPESQAAVGRAMERFGSPELRKFLDETGLGNHPELYKFVHRIGKAIAEDKVAGTTGAKAEDDKTRILREMYPTMFPKE